MNYNRKFVHKHKLILSPGFQQEGQLYALKKREYSTSVPGHLHIIK